VNAVISWGLGLILLNYVIVSLTGVPLIWCAIQQAAQPLAYYAALVNLSLAAGIVAGGIWQGPGAAIRMAVLLVAFNLLPSVFNALMSFGYRCG